jgi:hypothetical protein
MLPPGSPTGLAFSLPRLLYTHRIWSLFSGEGGPQTSDRKLSKFRVTPFVPIPRTHMGFAMHTAGEQYSTSQASRPSFGSYVMEGQLRPPALSFDSDLESRPSGELNPLRKTVTPVAF